MLHHVLSIKDVEEEQGSKGSQMMDRMDGLNLIHGSCINNKEDIGHISVGVSSRMSMGSYVKGFACDIGMGSRSIMGYLS